jgi:hypothetical protein
MRSKDTSPVFKGVGSPNSILSTSNKLISQEKKFLDFNSSYDRTFYKATIIANNKKISPFRQAKLKKGNSSEFYKDSLIGNYRDRTNSSIQVKYGKSRISKVILDMKIIPTKKVLKLKDKYAN